MTTTCMDCAHWSPESTSAGLVGLEHAVCTKRPTPGLTFGAHARVCLRYVPADAKTAAARHEKWDYQSKQGVLSD